MRGGTYSISKQNRPQLFYPLGSLPPGSNLKNKLQRQLQQPRRGGLQNLPKLR